MIVGEPHPELRELLPGCVRNRHDDHPPGETATLAFELSMHTGEDGWHAIAVHVPLRAGSTDHILEVQVNGDFTST